MKIRAGFVSNSSSASYYVTLKGSKDEVLSEIFDNCCYPHIFYENLEVKVKDKLEGLQSRLNDLETKKERFLLGNIPKLKKKIKDVEQTKTRLKELKEEVRQGMIGKHRSELTEIALELNYIDLKYCQDKILLESKTIMHNSYCEGMPDMLKDIVLYYSFENPNNIQLRVEHHNIG